MKLKIYLADLFHDGLGANQYVPLNIGYIGAYIAEKFGNDISVDLFKSPDELLDNVDKEPPHILALSNYCWNSNLNEFVGKQVKGRFPDIPIIMGGPNIRTEESGISEFLERANYVDAYTIYSSEVVFAGLIETALGLDAFGRSESARALSNAIRKSESPGAYSLVDGSLVGSPREETRKDLDFIPSPYLNGMLDRFLDQNMIPVIETNRGCPFSCTFCVWGIAALSKVKTFSLESVYADLDYVSHYGQTFPQLCFADANFGILKRDVEIAQYLRRLYEQTNAFPSVDIYWSKSAQPHMLEVGKALGNLSNTYVAFQSLDPIVLSEMKRKNISLEKLANLVTGLRQFSHNAQTDILLGSPGETVDSHLRSLDGALSLGIDHIRGGEIQLLPGSELDSQESREKHRIKSKYRFFEGCAGVYRGELVYELQEVIRSSDAMTEEEMKRLRTLRAFFFGAVTIGELKPLVYVLRHFEKRLTKVLADALSLGNKDPVFAPVLRWVEEQVNDEFFDSPEDVATSLEEPENANLVINEGFFKLNFGVPARLIMHKEECDAYYRCLEIAVKHELAGCVSVDAIKELLWICRERNFTAALLAGNDKETFSVRASKETFGLLHSSGYLTQNSDTSKFDINFQIDTLSTKQISKHIASAGKAISLFSLSQMLQMNWGRTYLEPQMRQAS